jgi:DNA repair protein RecN (Recombination protein N)
MLVELTIKDFAIIDELSLNFGDGFTVITGETGAGKSILIDAVNMVLGGSTDKDFVRSGRDKTFVEATFKIPLILRSEIETLLNDNEIEFDSMEEITLSREVRLNGRSTSRINGSAVRTSVYQEIGSLLLDIHGQSENLKLLQPQQHIFLLDSFAGLDETRIALKTLVRRLHKIRREIDQLQQDEAAIARRMDILQYQLQEIHAAKLKTGEDAALKEESDRLSNAQRLLEHVKILQHLLTEAEADHTGALPQLNEAVLVLGKLTRLDPTISAYEELANNIAIQVEELADVLEDYAEKIDLSPQRLNEVEERLSAIQSLKRKYGGSIEAILEFATHAQEELDGITNSEERLIELRTQEEQLLKQIGEMGQSLSKNRQFAGERLSRMIEEQLKSLRMPNARFGVDIRQHDDPSGCYVGERRVAFDQTGIDDVNFMLSTNFGEPLKPLAKVASGGETSRSMLALKTVLSKADQTPTLIFDEVDAGIGGRLGMVVGEKLWRLSLNHQVLCVTHLAQLACFADKHIHVSKSVTGNRTVTHVKPLTTHDRLEELTAMLGPEIDSARHNAEDLVKLALDVKAGKPIPATG